MLTIQVPGPGLFSGIPSGRWVAVSRDQKKVLGTGRTIDQALRKAEANGEKHPFIARVPNRNLALILPARILPARTP